MGTGSSAFAAESIWRHGYSTQPMSNRPEKSAKPETISGPLFAVISIADQRISFYGSEGLAARAPISTGMRGHPTPTGVFSIVQKQRWHESNIYSSAPMPFMQRITWSGIAMHAGVLPGYPASHGCIRMPASFAQRMFGLTQIGQRVIVAPRDAAPVDVAHKNLPVPKLSPALEEPEVSAAGSAGTTAAIDSPQAKDGGQLEQVSISDATRVTKSLNPIEQARTLKRDANEKTRLAARAAKAAQLLGTTKTMELRVAIRKLGVAERGLDRAADKLAAATRRLEKADGEEAVKNGTDDKVALEAALAEAQKTVDEARVARDARDHERAAARRKADEAKAAGKAASQSLVEANRRLQPLSVFISRKTGRLYVRQNFQPLFDAPITISNPDQPIGTHVYVSTRPANDGSALNWVAVSMPPPEIDTKSPARASKHSRGAGSDAPAIAPAPVANPAPETAAGALDRVTIPEETEKRMAELTWVGASVIISDQGISGETGDTTDFIILTRSRASAP